jgi:hypothetical protein
VGVIGAGLGVSFVGRSSQSPEATFGARKLTIRKTVRFQSGVTFPLLDFRISRLNREGSHDNDSGR